MGAIARQVDQVKRKNSTNCNSPDARLTVVGSVASRSGPREVATAGGIWLGVSVGKASGCVTAGEGDPVGTEVEVATSTALVGVADRAQAVNKITASRLRVRVAKRKGLVISWVIIKWSGHGTR